MRLRIVVDQTYWQTPDGRVWTRMPPAYGFFASHLRHFSEIEVIARTQPASEPPERARPASGPGVVWRPVPRYAGLAGFLRRSPGVLAALAHPLPPPAALLLRIPSHLANLLYWRRRGAPFAVEVLGDPAMLYDRDPLYRSWFTSNLQRQCREAVAAAYVSGDLERRYPSPNPHRLLDIELPPEAFGSPRSDLPSGPLHIVTVGGFDHPTKGHDVLIRATALLPGARLTIAGAGRLLPQLEQEARTHGVQVRFAGQLGGPAEVRELLRSADIFALASRSEGMPRALLEAMALGAPAVATNVGGIPEILPPDQLVPPGDPAALAAAIRATSSDPERYRRISAQGIAVARHYSEEIERRKRDRFLQELREAADLHFEERQAYAC
jgi:glycosyltransferase involved in cell wall biosynthesis